jgi:hypothetical protein
MLFLDKLLRILYICIAEGDLLAPIKGHNDERITIALSSDNFSKPASLISGTVYKAIDNFGSRQNALC